MSTEAQPARSYEIVAGKQGWLRGSEWVLLSYFLYAAIISPWFPLRRAADGRTLVLAIAVACLLLALAYVERRWRPRELPIIRDWTPLAFTFMAYQTMDWFTPLQHTQTLEPPWMAFDHLLLAQWGLRAGIENAGFVLPVYLELCYLLVYGIGAFCIATLYFQHRRERVNRFLQIYLLGTLLAYAMLPYFPSQPPRVLYPDLDAPQITSVIRQINLWLVGHGGIHASVVPSAHVSSAFSAAWAMFSVMPERKKIGWGLLVYAVSVSVATVYGRYHYAVDAIVGLGASMVAVLFATRWKEKAEPRTTSDGQ